MDRCPPDLERFGDIDRSACPAPSARAPETLLSTAGGLCRRQQPSFQLPLAPQVGFELREDAQHVQEALAGGGAGVDRLLRGLQDRAARPDSANDVLKVSDASGEAMAWKGEAAE
jgi:hypothetical protein